MDYPMRPFIGNEEASLFYSAPDAVSGELDTSRIDEERGTVAHVRGYFDNSGEGLCTTFFGHNDNRLTTPKFTAELKKFMDSLRKDGPLQSVRTLRRFCAENGEGKLPDQARNEYGFISETELYRFCLRLSPQRDVYQVYVYAYDLNAQREYVRTTQCRELLTARLDGNLLSRAATLGGNPTVSALHELGRHIAMHEYLTVNCPLKTAEIDRLLQFQDPLEVAVECTGLGNTIHDLDIGFFLDRANPEETFPMMSHETGQNTPEQRQEATTKKPGKSRSGKKNPER